MIEQLLLVLLIGSLVSLGLGTVVILIAGEIEHYRQSKINRAMWREMWSTPLMPPLNREHNQ